MESLFSFFFKYRPLLFEEGHFAFRVPWPIWVVVLLGLAGVAVAVTGYRRPKGKADRSDRIILAGLRLAAFAVLLFALLRPTLVNTSTVPQRNFVGVLLDDSRSMTLPGEDGLPRSTFIEEEFHPDEGPLLRALEEKFAVRFFRYSSSTDRVDGVSGLSFDGSRTDLVGALDRAREELSSVPLQAWSWSLTGPTTQAVHWPKQSFLSRPGPSPCLRLGWGKRPYLRISRWGGSPHPGRS